jgi:hypothetical protein
MDGIEYDYDGNSLLYCSDVNEMMPDVQAAWDVFI